MNEWDNKKRKKLENRVAMIVKDLFENINNNKIYSKHFDFYLDNA